MPYVKRSAGPAAGGKHARKAQPKDEAPEQAQEGRDEERRQEILMPSIHEHLRETAREIHAIADRVFPASEDRADLSTYFGPVEVMVLPAQTIVDNGQEIEIVRVKLTWTNPLTKEIVVKRVTLNPLDEVQA